MKALAGDTVGEPLLKSLWLGRIPNNTQTILNALKEDLAGLASVADKINDLAKHSNINSVTPETSDNRLAQLEKQVAQLTTLVGELTTTMRQSRSQSRNRNRPFKNRQSGKLNRRSSTGLGHDRQINRIMLADKVSKLKFLVDTGADVSVLPKYYAPKADSSNELLLLAANDTKIATFGKKRLTLDLNLRPNFTWSFIIANVNQPIIGLDF
ncbi:transposon Ty3-I Gag-Pol polyprotein [Trichonephila clavata]|uniref:Transposon Ty3-I Gag-Pol polyprotein n=1 Tax=Trichonephila clavata TaxID=2740835 RepID=A0A8X6FM34_TRICU|nr:transposon Ty3-I Gag-Pol polyprotein [Trichonephila clavata]